MDQLTAVKINLTALLFLFQDGLRNSYFKTCCMNDCAPFKFLGDEIIIYKLIYFSNFDVRLLLSMHFCCWNDSTPFKLESGHIFVA